MSSRGAGEVALRGAHKRRTVPYVHKHGRTVTVVLSVSYGRGDALTGNVQSFECASAGQAALVRQLATEALQRFPEMAERALQVAVEMARDVGKRAGGKT